MTRPRWRNPDKRMAHAVELRGKGRSLRQIGAELGVSEMTIRRDLARHEHEWANRAASVIPLRQKCDIPLRHVAPDVAERRSGMSQSTSQEDAG